MKLFELVALPPFVVTAIVAVVAPVGTVAVIFESEFTVNEADTLLNVTFVAFLARAGDRHRSADWSARAA